MRSALGTAGHQSTFHLHVLAARDSMLIMQCHVWKADLSNSIHDDVRDLFASLLKDVCHDVEVQPHLQPLTGEVIISSANSSDDARLDVSARGFWQRGQRAFFDVRVFNPFAKSHLNQKLDTAFSSNENEKKRHYNQRIIEVEHGSFSSLDRVLTIGWKR